MSSHSWDMSLNNHLSCPLLSSDKGNHIGTKEYMVLRDVRHYQHFERWLLYFLLHRNYIVGLAECDAYWQWFFASAIDGLRRTYKL